jgi:hypothetical protein
MARGIPEVDEEERGTKASKIARAHQGLGGLDCRDDEARAGDRVGQRLQSRRTHASVVELGHQGLGPVQRAIDNNDRSDGGLSVTKGPHDARRQLTTGTNDHDGRSGERVAELTLGHGDGRLGETRRTPRNRGFVAHPSPGAQAATKSSANSGPTACSSSARSRARRSCPNTSCSPGTAERRPRLRGRGGSRPGDRSEWRDGWSALWPRHPTQPRGSP